ncbi:hypothetical protein AC251_13035 [Ralstonia pseudosolanacearum]|uniref:hypothetical protein n=1 Tax=Ralstonia pseudosolanacearum TaxID=1310165 RepID=UPI00090B6CFB|nr:hypothetical protein [Ralstonia pseudosolanacearum]API75399.1 hypothetical protein AC251_13035 [Ralstonia pseudosolanacearum]
MTVSNSIRLPAGDADLSRLCRLSHAEPQLKPLVFEALLHARIAVLCDPGNSPPPSGTLINNDVLLRQVRHPEAGIPEFSNAVFSDLIHFHAFAPDKAPHHCVVPESTLHLIEDVAGLPIPLVIDPGTRHAVVLPSAELRTWLARWRDTPLATDPLEHDTLDTQPGVACSALLLDRLAVFLVMLPTVERAYLLTGTIGSTGGSTLTLAVTCNDTATEMRIRSALPLLEDGLEMAPLSFLPLARYAQDVRYAVDMHWPAVYDRALGQWTRWPLTHC